eukprot:m.169777 g.169777  ORF g.169777 m.169777 type:complete len:55 (-) comp16672_c0_seq7:5116-5280(-)
MIVEHSGRQYQQFLSSITQRTGEAAQVQIGLLYLLVLLSLGLCIMWCAENDHGC